eukprot:CAMPEP_0117655372 /NCGR_PEP_ID=MMETSP0804-20121206/4244_1 /TAXON_ID=1074897 /ORGANISM="Tetraselmis astigmatica, Strain CCMP880" /LENGTH=444 /DNA_ID=CAMNT_0005461719 /DNA_START=93 /DNA_END=1424 /DNA_ORIENTATION=-
MANGALRVRSFADVLSQAHRRLFCGCNASSTGSHDQTAAPAEGSHWIPPEPKPAPGRQRLPLIDGDGRVLLKGLNFPDMESWCIAHGFKPARAKQLWRAIYVGNGVSSWKEARDGGLVGKSPLAQLEAVATLDGGLQLQKVHESQDGTQKLVFRAQSSHGEAQAGGAMVEAVLIPMRGQTGERTTLCVSSQVGCAMNCKFCLTGRLGLLSDLSTAQVVEQVLVARRLARPRMAALGRAPTGQEQAISNVVFMGMGEPLANLPAVSPALDILTAAPGLQFSPSRITVSTSGLMPQLRQLAASHPRVQLAVSLNATTDEVRSGIMPVNRRWPLRELTQTLREIFPAAGQVGKRYPRTVLVEYIMLEGINDSQEDAARLLHLLSGVAAKINLIQFNPHEGTTFQGSDSATINAVWKVLTDAGYLVTLRHSRGDDTMAACGQLGVSVG